MMNFVYIAFVYSVLIKLSFSQCNSGAIGSGDPRLGIYTNSRVSWAATNTQILANVYSNGAWRGWKLLDNENCDDFKLGTMDYFDEFKDIRTPWEGISLYNCGNDGLLIETLYYWDGLQQRYMWGWKSSVFGPFNQDCLFNDATAGSISYPGSVYSDIIVDGDYAGGRCKGVTFATGGSTSTIGSVWTETGPGVPTCGATPANFFKLVLTLQNPSGVPVTDVGQTQFNKLFWGSPNHILYRYCPTCETAWRHIYYKRLTLTTSFDLYSSTQSWLSTNNRMGTDFNLYSSLSDALSNSNPWRYCNYDDANVGMFRDCGPTGFKAWQWTSRLRGGKGAAFYIYSAYDGSIIGSPDLETPQFEERPNELNDYKPINGGYYIEITKPIFLAIAGLIASVVVINFIMMCYAKKNKRGNKGYGVVKHIDSDSEYA